MPPSPALPAAAMPAAAGLSFDELALLLGLPVGEAAALARGASFDGPSGLACRLLVDAGVARPASAQPSVLLGLNAAELAGAEVARLLALQAQLLAEDAWYLGATADGELQVTALRRFETAPALAAALDAAHLVAAVALRLLLQPADRAQGGPAVPSTP